MLYKKGLAYQAEALVNYDPVDKTVLANEQVDNNGRSWRSGAVVEQRLLRQWFFRITAFQDSLLHDLDVLAENNRWPDRVIQQQRHWIGRSEGATIQFDIQQPNGSKTPVKVFTTRPDTLFGVQYLALSLSHPIVQQLAEKNAELASFISRKASFGPDSKEGFELDIRALHPATNLDPKFDEQIPVFAAPYVLEGYGEGAVMGVPAHDTRDFSFWKLQKPSETPITVVQANQANESLEGPFTDHGILTAACGLYAGLESQEASRKIVEDLSKQSLAKQTQTWRLRDWLISRQRYWGTPIPIIHCKSCGAVPVPEHQLPVELPKLGQGVQGQKGNPLDSIDSFVDTECPSCGKPAKRETDTMDTFVDSSWYYARFPDSQNERGLFSKQAASQMLPVDMYIGGVEHAILHLLYARFIFKFLFQVNMVPITDNLSSKEPFSRLIAQGMVHGKTFSDPETGKFLKPDELTSQADRQAPLVKRTGQQAAITWEKMSKSKHNGVDPMSCFEKYGADVTRAHMLFAAPLSEVLQWDEEKIVGMQRWLFKLSRLIDDFLAIERTSANPPSDTPNLADLPDASAEMLLLADTTIRTVTNTVENNIYNINTVVSDLIKLTNALHEAKIANLDHAVAQQVLITLLKLLAPIAPAFAEQSWEDIHTRSPSKSTSQNIQVSSIFTESWPEQLLNSAEVSALGARKTTITCAVQINGKVKFTTSIPAPEIDEKKKVIKSQQHEDAVLEAVLKSSEGMLWLTERNEWSKKKRVVVVNGGKVVNIVF